MASFFKEGRSYGPAFLSANRQENYHRTIYFSRADCIAREKKEPLSNLHFLFLSPSGESPRRGIKAGEGAGCEILYHHLHDRIAKSTCPINRNCCHPKPILCKRSKSGYLCRNLRSYHSSTPIGFNTRIFTLATLPNV